MQMEVGLNQIGVSMRNIYLRTAEGDTHNFYGIYDAHSHTQTIKRNEYGLLSTGKSA